MKLIATKKQKIISILLIIIGIALVIAGIFRGEAASVFNKASRMESTGEPMRIHVSESTHAQTARHFAYGEGIEVEVKGKGLMKTYYL